MDSETKRDIVRKIKDADKKQRKKYLAAGVGISIGAFLLLAYFVGSIIAIFKLHKHSAIYYGLTDGLLVSVIWFAVMAFLLLIAWKRESKKNSLTVTDDRGVTYMKNGTKGTSHWAEEEEVAKSFTISDIHDSDEMVFGQYSSSGEKVVTFKQRKGASGTRHVLMVAKSGSGKSFSFVLPNILQAIRRGDSIIVVDPSGELYEKLGQYCRNSGYDVKLLNLSDLNHSEFWDCLQETIDESTGRLESARLQSFTNIYMKNSAESADQNFWYQCAENLIEAAIGYLAVKRETKILDAYISLYEKMTGEIGSKFADMCRNKFVSFPWCEDLLIDTAKKFGYDVDKLKQTFVEIKENAPEFNMKVLYETLNHIEELEEEFENLPQYHPAYSAYLRYKTNSKDVVKAGAIQGAQLKFKIFDNEKLRETLSHPGIDFKTINFKKSCYFLGIPDTDNSMKPIASLFFSFFFKDVQENFDRERAAATFEGRKMRCLPVMALLDEFASLGVIGGDANQFRTIMSDCRKRNISVLIILQYISSLVAIYEDNADAILSNCEITLCLGANELTTQKFISDKTGIATVFDEKHNEGENLFGSKATDNQYSVGGTQRTLMNPDEVGQMVNTVLVLAFGCRPFKLHPFPWIEHPAYVNGECEPTSYFNIPVLEDRLMEIEIKKPKDPETYVKTTIDSFKRDGKVSSSLEDTQELPVITDETEATAETGTADDEPKEIPDDSDMPVLSDEEDDVMPMPDELEPTEEIPIGPEPEKKQVAKEKTVPAVPQKKETVVQELPKEPEISSVGINAPQRGRPKKHKSVKQEKRVKTKAVQSDLLD